MEFIENFVRAIINLIYKVLKFSNIDFEVPEEIKPLLPNEEADAEIF